MAENVREVRARGTVCGKCLPARYVMAIMGSAGLAIIYGLKVNFHVGIVSMVNRTELVKRGNIKLGANETVDPKEDGPFAWPPSLQGWLLSSYFWGYMVAQLPGGRMAEVLSAQWVMLFAVIINIVCTLLIPICAKWHYSALMVMRVAQGIGGGVSFPSSHVLLAHWAPPSERSTMTTIVYAGTALGTVLMTLLTGLIAGSINWESVYYIEGGMCVVWIPLWVLFGSNFPDQERFISLEERQFIKDSLHDKQEGHGHATVPWKLIWTSLPFWAIIVAHTCSNWGWYMVLMELPTYMSEMLKFNIKANGVLSSIPYFTMWIFTIFLGKILDFLRSKEKIQTTTARKVASGIACIIPSICFIILSYQTNRTVAVVMMTIAITACGAMFSGFLCNHIDIAANYAGTLMAITNTVATIPGITVPMFVGWLTDKGHTTESWRLIFWVTCGFYAVGTTFYMIFGSGNEQSWNNFSGRD